MANQHERGDYLAFEPGSKREDEIRKFVDLVHEDRQEGPAVAVNEWSVATSGIDPDFSPHTTALRRIMETPTSDLFYNLR